MPGLDDEGYIHPDESLPATLILKPEDDGVKTNFFFRHYGKTDGEIGIAGPQLENVNISKDDLVDSLRHSKVVVIDHDGPVDSSLFGRVTSNILMLDSRDRPNVSSIQRLRDIADLAIGNLYDSANGTDKSAVVALVKTEKDSLAVVFPRPGSGPGRILNLRDPTSARRLRDLVKADGAGGRMFVFGDAADAQKVSQTADEAGVEVIRRGVTVHTPFAITDAKLESMRTPPLSPPRIAFLNGLPNSVPELRAMKLPSGGVVKWKDAHARLEMEMAGKFKKRISTKLEFLHVLEGDNIDAVFVAAHAERKLFYIKGERVTFQELENLPSRKHGRTRVAILASCSTGELAELRRGILSPETHSLADILIRKKFFDVVIAPDHEITDAEGLAVITAVLSGKSLATIRASHPGWYKIAERKWRWGLTWPS